MVAPIFLQSSGPPCTQIYFRPPRVGRGNEGSGAGGDLDVRPRPPEYHRPVYRHSADTGAMSGGGAASGGMGVDDMEGSGQA